MTLSQLPGVGLASFWSIVNHCGDPEGALRCTSKELQLIEGIGKRQLAGFSQKEKVSKSCSNQLDRLQDRGGICLPFSHDSYPAMLKEISDPPPVLYVLGDTTALNETLIAMVGSRASTNYGNRIAYTLGKNLANGGVTVISGMALGIDTESHRGALAGEGKTIGVLGCGVDVVYPRQNHQLFHEIIENGAIISEYPLGTQPEGFRFPARNRIIAGMSRGVVVVEAAKKSGSLITAQLALEEGREVYAVPGQVDSYKSDGSHWLLKQGAKLVQSEKDILEDLSMAYMSVQRDTGTIPSDNPDIVEPEARQILALLDGYPLSREKIIEKTALPVSLVSEMLLLLELEGVIEVLPGDEIRKLH